MECFVDFSCNKNLIVWNRVVIWLLYDVFYGLVIDGVIIWLGENYVLFFDCYYVDVFVECICSWLLWWYFWVFFVFVLIWKVDGSVGLFYEDIFLCEGVFWLDLEFVWSGKDLLIVNGEVWWCWDDFGMYYWYLLCLYEVYVELWMLVCFVWADFVLF